jgi:hypothetical protein
MATANRNMVVPDEDVQLMLECSYTDLSSVDFEADNNNSFDDGAVIDTFVGGDDCNEAVPASAENFVWESMSNNTGQINGT